MNNQVLAKIRQRRLQILVHSCIYYQYDTNIITDTQWNNWSRELVQLQKSNPEESQAADWAKAFENFNGSTGMDLPITDEWVMNKAIQLLHYKGENLYGSSGVKQYEYLMPEKPVQKKNPNIKRRKLF